MKVLLSDDSKTIRMILKSLLVELGVTEIQEAGNGQEAMDYLFRDTYDVVLLDIHMPQVDGLQVLDALKTREDSLHKETPVVIISSDTDYRQIEKARGLHAFGYIKKPFKKEGLEAAIGAARKLAEKRAAAAQAKAAAPEPAAKPAPAPVAAARSAPAPAPTPVAAEAEPAPAKKGGLFGWLRRIIHT